MKITSYTSASFPASSPSASPQGTRRARNPGRIISGSLLIFSLGFAALFFGGSFLISPAASVESNVVGVGFASPGERDIALVPYGRSGGRGMFEMMFRSMFQQRLAAVDLETGERVWDVSIKDDLAWDAGVLGAGEQYAYLTSPDGLIIVDLSDGDIVARDGDIDGLGADYVAAYMAYGFDAERKVIVAMAADGGIRSIPLDSLTAAPADAAVSAAWTGRLSDSGPPIEPTAMETEARLDGTDRVAVHSTTAGSLASTLVRLNAQGAATPIGDTVFYNAGIMLDLTQLPDDGFGEAAALTGIDDFADIVDWPIAEQIEYIREQAAVEGLSEAEADELALDATRRAAGQGAPAHGDDGTPPAAGAAAGFVIVQHAEHQNDDDSLLGVVSLDTGQIVSSLPMGYRAGRAMTAPSGVTVVNVQPVGEHWPRDLAIVGEDGKLTHIEIGATNFFGFPI